MDNRYQPQRPSTLRAGSPNQPQTSQPIRQTQRAPQQHTQLPRTTQQNTAQQPVRKRKKKGLGYRRRRNALLILIALIILIAVVCSRCDGCRKISDNSGIQPVDAPAVTTEATDGSGTATDSTLFTEQPTTSESNDGSIRVIAVGDNLVQTKVYGSAAEHAENGESYNFDYVYEGAKDLITGADLSIINQETLICGDPSYEISGSNYNFNSPPELGDALMRLGFNTVSLSNNHLLDKGIDGLFASLDYWDAMKQAYPDLVTYGVYRDVADMENIRIKEVNGLKVAFLAYTENINGYSVPSDSTAQIILTSQEALIQSQIEAADDLADIVIVSSHWGVEDTFTVTDGVKAQAQNFIEWGADVIIGNHSHVPQTMEYLTRTDGTQGFVFYSLGNFVSAQTYNINIIGEVADFEMMYDGETGNVTVENIKVRPVITQYDDGSLSNLRLIAYKDYTEELAAAHGLPYAMGNDYGVWNMDRIKEIIDTAIPAEFQKLD